MLQAEQSETQAYRCLEQLKVGQWIELQFDVPVTTRVKLPLIGFDIGKYFIVKYPDPKKRGNYSDVLRPSHPAICRLVEAESGECIAFKTHLRSVTRLPEPLVFINYPKAIETRQLRQTSRIQTYLPAAIKAFDDELELQESNLISGVVTDLSAKGCCFMFKNKARSSGVKRRPVILSFVMPGATEATNVSAQVRNSHRQEDMIKVGIQFDETVAEIEQLISSTMS